MIIGGPNPLQVPRSSSTGGEQDPYFRSQPTDAWFSYNDTPAGTDGGDYVSPDTLYDVVFGGSADFPARIYDDALYMPPAFDLLTPGLTDTPYALTDSAHTFSWSVPIPQNLPSGLEIFSLVLFTGKKGPALVCIEPNDGSMEIPKDKIDIVRAYYANGNDGADGTGTISWQMYAHAVREQAPAVDCALPKRLDVIGAWAYEQTFSVE